MSAKDRLRAYFESNVGKKVTTARLRKVAGISTYARRIRELRDEEGMQIHSHNDSADLKPGEYVLASPDRLPKISRGITPQLRLDILERNGFTCQLCGAGARDPDPYNPTRKLRLHVDHIVPISQGGTDDKENLRALCSACNQPRANLQAPSETALNLLARLRRAPRAARREVYEALRRSFGEEPELHVAEDPDEGDA